MSTFLGECSEKTWLMRIAINTCRDFQRGSWFRHLDRRVTPEELSPSDQEAGEERLELMLVIMRLPRHMKEVILLHYYQGMTTREIAGALRVSQTTVSTRLNRARARLRALAGRERIDMSDTREMERVRDTINTALSGLRDDPWLAQKALVEAKSGRKVRKRFSIGVAVCVVKLLLSAAALAAVFFNIHQVEMFENVTVGDLLAEQWRQYDVCHKVSGGYLIGGFELGDDYVSPMSDEDKILYLDESFTPIWTLEDERLDGCLFDKVRETGDAFYFGIERGREKWNAALMKVSREGKILWMYEKEAFRAKDILVTDEGTAYLAGKDEKTWAMLLKVDQNGYLQWEESLEEYGLIVLNALCEWNDGIMGAGLTDKGITLLQIDQSGGVRASVAYDIEKPIDAVRLNELADGRTALIFTISPDMLDGRATEETKYMIVSDEIFEQK